MSLNPEQNVEVTKNGVPDSLLNDSIDQYGLIHNVIGVLVEAPEVFEEYLNISCYSKLHQLFMKSTFNLHELRCIWLAISTNKDSDQNCPKLRVLHSTARKISCQERIILDDLALLLDCGYTQEQLLELVCGLSQEMMNKDLK